MIRTLSYVFATLIVVLSPAAAFAQAGPGAVEGRVRDSSGAAIPGATVRIVNEETGADLQLVTDGEGMFQSESLGPGRYAVDVTLDGFDAVNRKVVIGAAQDAAQIEALEVTLNVSRLTESVVVTARRVEDVTQEIPIPISAVDGALAADAGAFNVNRLKEMIPTVQFYSTNPRNSAINIRGLGAPFGLTNDGLEPGVGLYIDGIFYARPAAAALDFLDVDRIEVLRGPLGTMFGKNTTAGAINVTTRKPAFSPATELEINLADLGFVQAKASTTGPLSSKVAGRVSFSATRRDGALYNARTRERVNDLNNLGVRGQMLFAPSDRLAIIAAVDHTRQRLDGYTQVVAGVAPTLRPANRQYPQIAADLGYTPPSYNAFDRLTDVDSPLRADQDLGGVSLNIDSKLRHGQLTSTTAWRYWNWDPASDRDFIGLPVTTVSAAPSTQRQLTQEVRYTRDLSPRMNIVVGAFGFHQSIDSNPAFVQEQGSAAARFLLAPTPAAATPGLLDGYGYKQYMQYGNTSAAVFGQFSWALTDRLRLMPGIRFNYDHKDVDFDQQVYGGLQTTDPALIALKLSVLAPQAYKTAVGDGNQSGQVTVGYKLAQPVNAYATYATGFKSVGLNLNGVPTDALGRPVLSAATVKPEDVHNIEVGVKTEPFRGVTANLAVFDTDIRNFQAQVTNGSVGVIRGYLANAERVRVRGAEFDGNARVSPNLSFYSALAFTDAKYVTFTDAPPALEDTGGPQFVDISGTVLPGVSRWAFSYGGEYSHRATLLQRAGQLFVALDGSHRSSFSSSATFSKYLVVDGYSLVNARAGFRTPNGWTLSVWSRNLLNKDYFELLTPAPGNTGLYVGQPGDQRSIGVTMRVGLRFQ